MFARQSVRIFLFLFALFAVMTVPAPSSKVATEPVPTANAQSTTLLQPFGGIVVDVDYVTCSCGFIIFTVFDVRTFGTYRIIHFYVAQVLEQLGLSLEIPIPRLYMFPTALIPGYQPYVVGNYVPYAGAPCATICQNGCCLVEPGAVGYLFNMGASGLPANQ